MSKTAVITARVDEETLALVDRVSKAHNRSRAWFVARAITEAARKEAEFLAFVQVGIDAADRGELIPHEEVVAKIDAMIAKHKARCAS
jgi:predicted transcriptional regulator